ncbi:hypothetical protein BC835DRAFT_1265166 [Cytidiella melzeri]|nr:hypothetical protein BC835DRAFT_1265166 [Cytidiella melzeri]
MSNARREQQQKARVSSAAAAASTGDDDAKRKAVMNVVQVWLDRLQLISTITTFFAGIDGTILSFTISLTHVTSFPVSQWTVPQKVLLASLVGALIFHVCAAITSFTASFVLIRYRLVDMTEHLHIGGPRPSSATDRTMAPSGPSSPVIGEKPRMMPRFESSPAQVEATHSKDSSNATFFQHAGRDISDMFDFFQNVTGTKSEVEGRVFIHQASPLSCFRSRPNNNGMNLDPPIRLLSRCHSLSVTMASLGFILALVGILLAAWTALPIGVSIFSSVCLGGCLFSVFCVMMFNC